MGIFDKFFGVSQRQAWANAAYKLGGKSIPGSTWEADQIEFYYLGKLAKIYITSRGDLKHGGIYTVIETTFNSIIPLMFNEEEFSRKKMEVVKIANGFESTYWVRHRDPGVVKEEKELLENCEIFKSSLESLLKNTL
ncbi:MAG: hypothetical protein MUF42_12495 [Cytophagaceae bacterium]|jgi:hypothetical protein|nr:hypothetical protein [Cytophagaceae bacterium]